MKHSILLLTTLLILIVLSAAVVVDGKNCKHIKHCIPTPTPTATATAIQQQIVFYPIWNIQGVWNGTGYVCRLFGTQFWFACQPYSVRLPSGQTLYGFIRA